MSGIDKDILSASGRNRVRNSSPYAGMHPGSHGKSHSLMSFSDKNDDLPRLCHMYASPLVREVDGHYVPVDKLQYEQERNELLAVLGRGLRAIAFNSEAATPRSFLRNLTQCTVMHFTGHGLPGALTLEDGVGRMQLVDENNIQEWLDGKDFIPELVFISACYSESVANGFLKAGVRHVVAVSKENTVLDREAVNFMGHFYDMLLDGDSINQAFEKARQALELEPDGQQEAAKFRLLPANEAHSERPFWRAQSGVYIDLTRPPFPSQMVSSIDYFIGRELEVQMLVHTIKEPSIRSVCISGPSGIGKTQVIAKACEYIRERHLVDEILYIPMYKSSVSNANSISNECTGTTVIATSLGLQVEHFDPNFAEEYLISKIVAKFGSDPRKSYIFVFDGVHPWLIRGHKQMSSFIDRLLENPMMRNVVAVTSAIQPLGVRGEKVIELKGLSPIKSAEVFCRAAPRAFSPAELTDGSTALHIIDDGQLFSRSEFITLLGGNPGCIVAVSESLREYSLLKDSLYIKTEIIPQKKAELLKRDDQFMAEFEENVQISVLVEKAPTNIETENMKYQEMFAESLSRYDNPKVQNFYVPKNYTQPDDRIKYHQNLSSTKVRTFAKDEESNKYDDNFQYDPNWNVLKTESLVEQESNNLYDSTTIPVETPDLNLIYSDNLNDLMKLKTSDSLVETLNRSLLYNDNLNDFLSGSSGIMNVEKITKDFAVIEDVDVEAEKIWNSVKKSVVKSDTENDNWAPKWDELCKFGLAVYAEERLGNFRKFSQEDFDFLGTCAKLWLPYSSPGSEPERVESPRVLIDGFQKVFFPWFFDAVKMLSFSKIWNTTSPHFILGLNELLPMRYLKDSPSGTFLFRLSMSQRLTLVLCYMNTKGTTIKNVLINVRYNDVFKEQFYDIKVDQTIHTYPNLKALLMNEASLLYLYPNIPKSEAVRQLADHN